MLLIRLFRFTFFHILSVLICLIIYMYIIWLYVLYASFLILEIMCFIVMHIFSYCYVCYVLGILFHCVVLFIVCVQTCTVPLPPGVSSVAVNTHTHTYLR